MANSTPVKPSYHIRPMEYRDITRTSDICIKAFDDDELVRYIRPGRYEYPLSYRRTVSDRLRKRMCEPGLWAMVCVPSPHAYDHDKIMGYAIWKRHPGTSLPDSTDAEKLAAKKNDTWNNKNTSYMHALCSKLLKLEGKYYKAFKLDKSTDYDALDEVEQVIGDEEAVFRPLYAGVRHWYLAGLAVDPAYQRKGVATTLVKWGMEMAREESQLVGFSVPVTLTASAEGANVYPRLGFKIIDWLKVPAALLAICPGDEGSAFIWDVDNTWIEEAPPETKVDGRRVDAVWTQRAKNMLKDKTIKGNELLEIGKPVEKVDDKEQV